jgi:hypothetical protein
MQICDERLIFYQDLWQAGMYRKDGKWNLDCGSMLTLTFTTKEALYYVRNRSSD